MERERGSLQRELDTKTAMAETLQAENERLDAMTRQLQEQLGLAMKVGDIQVVEVKLPPELDRALQDFAAQYPEAVEYDPQRGAVRWKSDLTFALGSDKVQDSVRNSLKSFADIVNSPAAAAFEVVVVGHTDDVRITPATAQKHPTNWHLSVHRAVAVMFALHQYGVDFKRIGCMGYGEYRPRKPNPPHGGCEANRRVEIFLVASGEQPAGMDTSPGEAKEGSTVAKTESD
ncbi:MAG: OmpA family protein [Phycisphaerae bacterium]|nr:OmpA family protein [Phycisphaerae bacterium]